LSRENRKRSAAAFGRAALAILATSASAAEGDLVLTPNVPMLFALIALFIALIFPVNALLFRPIFAALDAREEKIAGTRARAAKLAEEADAVLKRYQDSVRQVRAEAEQGRRGQLADAKGSASEQLASARGDAEREIERARGEIQSALTAARSSLRGEAETLAREASARILGRDLS
jgi:F-type H+-transporting ATPase subunit b